MPRWRWRVQKLLLSKITLFTMISVLDPTNGDPKGPLQIATIVPDEGMGRRMSASGDSIFDKNGRKRCTATNNRGDQCGKMPILGGFVCRLHGGGNPYVKAAANRRLRQLVDPAIDALLHALETGDRCDKCGRSDDMSIVLKASQLILDRAGHGPAAKLTVAQAAPGTLESETWVKFLTSEELETINRIMTTAKGRQPIEVEASEVPQLEEA